MHNIIIIFQKSFYILSLKQNHYFLNLLFNHFFNLIMPKSEPNKSVLILTLISSMLQSQIMIYHGQTSIVTAIPSNTNARTSEHMSRKIIINHTNVPILHIITTLTKICTNCKVP